MKTSRLPTYQEMADYIETDAFVERVKELFPQMADHDFQAIAPLHKVCGHIQRNKFHITWLGAESRQKLNLLNLSRVFTFTLNGEQIKLAVGHLPDVQGKILPTDFFNGQRIINPSIGK